MAVEEMVTALVPVLVNPPLALPPVMGAEMMIALFAALTTSSLVVPIARDSLLVGWIVSVPVPAFRMPLSVMPPVVLELMVTPLPV